MKFVDEATIDVIAGNGGAGCVGFRREKFIPFGGPNGGDGGRGGSVFAVGDRNLNTLIDFRYARRHEARNGEAGRGSDQFGAAADDIVLRMPMGTIIRDAESDALIAELLVPGEKVLLVKGGDGGFGNLHFKSSTNRAPRQKTPGWPGEQKKLKLELRVLADVGLLGMPNAGKSTLIAAVSNARPKIADYPFTTLHPNLGVVRVGPEQSFVMADIPGLIEGAAEGAGLGHYFLRHLQRTRLLLHVVDMAPFDDAIDPVAQAQGHHRRAEEVRPQPLRKAALAGSEQARHGADRGARQALRRSGPAPALEASGVPHLGADARGLRAADARRVRAHRGAGAWRRLAARPALRRGARAGGQP